MKLSRFLLQEATLRNILASVNEDGKTSVNHFDIISKTTCTDVPYARHTFITTEEGDWAEFIDEETAPVPFQGWTYPAWQLSDLCTRVCYDDVRCVAANIKRQLTADYFSGDCDLFDKNCVNLEPSFLWEYLAFEITEQESTRVIARLGNLNVMLLINSSKPDGKDVYIVRSRKMHLAYMY